MKDLTLGACKDYFPSPNYTISKPKHGPPGCWLRTGDGLRADLAYPPGVSQILDRGFGCWVRSDWKGDDMECSPETPCVCK